MESSQTLCEEGLLFFPFYPGETEAKEVNNLPKVVRLLRGRARSSSGILVPAPTGEANTTLPQ